MANGPISVKECTLLIPGRYHSGSLIINYPLASLLTHFPPPTCCSQELFDYSCLDGVYAVHPLKTKVSASEASNLLERSPPLPQLLCLHSDTLQHPVVSERSTHLSWQFAHICPRLMLINPARHAAALQFVPPINRRPCGLALKLKQEKLAS